jgi:hypothetical protein
MILSGSVNGLIGLSWCVWMGSAMVYLEGLLWRVWRAANGLIGYDGTYMIS